MQSPHCWLIQCAVYIIFPGIIGLCIWKLYQFYPLVKIIVESYIPPQNKRITGFTGLCSALAKQKNHWTSAASAPPPPPPPPPPTSSPAVEGWALERPVEPWSIRVRWTPSHRLGILLNPHEPWSIELSVKWGYVMHICVYTVYIYIYIHIICIYIYNVYIYI